MVAPSAGKAGCSEVVVSPALQGESEDQVGSLVNSW